MNVDWDADDLKTHKTLERKLHKMLKVFYQKDIITKDEMNNLFNTDDAL